MNKFTWLIVAIIAITVFTGCFSNSTETRRTTENQAATPQTSIQHSSNDILAITTTSSVCSVIVPTNIYTGIPITKPVPPEGAFCEQNVSYVIDSGLTVTMNLIYVIACGSFYELNIDYRLENTTDKTLDEEIFKAYFANGSAEMQTGLFGLVAPGQIISKSYVWQAPWDNVITVIEFEADYSSNSPRPDTLKWNPPTS